MSDKNDIKKNIKAIRHILDIEKKRTQSKTPEILALVAPGGGGGSHLILHKMQLHPEMVVVNENYFVQDPVGPSALKEYFSMGLFPIATEELQLVPRKQLFETHIDESGEEQQAFKDGVIPRVLVLNKPPIKRMVYYRNLHYNSIKLMYLFRNPVAYYYSWKKKWENKSMDTFGIKPSAEMILYWYERMLMSSLYEYAQFYDAAQDSFISFDQFVSHPEKALRGIFRTADVAPIREL